MTPATNALHKPRQEVAEGVLGVGALPLTRKTSNVARARPAVPSRPMRAGGHVIPEAALDAVRMTPDTFGTLPPDPSVPGLWWMRNGWEWTVWAWVPGMGAWSLGCGDYNEPTLARAEGWRCIGPAVPPEVPSDAP